MKFRWTFFTVFFLVILILLLFFFEKMEERKKEEKLQAKKVFSFNKEKIDRITIKTDKGTISLSKEGNGLWNLIEPVNAKADFEVVSGIVNKLDEIHFTKSFNVSPKELSVYGLLPPKAEVSFSEGKKYFSFTIGEETPSVNSVYIKKGNENRILLVENRLPHIILRDVFEFRDKTVVKFDRKDASKLELIYPDKSFTVIKRDSQNWQMDKPIKVKAGTEEIDKVFDLLFSLRVLKFEGEKIADDKHYGFNKLLLKVLLDFNNKETMSLFFGENKDGIFVKLEPEEEVYAVNGEILDKLPKNSFDFRNKKLAPFNRDEIKSLILSSKEKSIEIEKDLYDKWVITKPVKTKGNAIEIEILINEILNLRMQEFVDNIPKSYSEIGLDPPEKEIILNGRDKKPLVFIKIGKLNTNKYLCYATNNLENQIGMIDYTFVRDYLNFDLEKLKAKI